MNACEQPQVAGPKGIAFGVRPQAIPGVITMAANAGYSVSIEYYDKNEDEFIIRLN
jgi:hypothetical protein